MRLCRHIAMPIAVAALLLGPTGCHHAASPVAPPQAPPGAVPTPAVHGSDAGALHSRTPLQDAIVSLLGQDASSAHPLFPKGTRLKSVTLAGGVATLNFSREFDQLADSGDSVESAVQKSLRAAVARVNGVQEMRVLVEGRRFESQVTDWSDPFPVSANGNPASESSQLISSSRLAVRS